MQTLQGCRHRLGWLRVTHCRNNHFGCVDPSTGKPRVTIGGTTYDGCWRVHGGLYKPEWSLPDCPSVDCSICAGQYVPTDAYVQISGVLPCSPDDLCAQQLAGALNGSHTLLNLNPLMSSGLFGGCHPLYRSFSVAVPLAEPVLCGQLILNIMLVVARDIRIYETPNYCRPIGTGIYLVSGVIAQDGGWAWRCEGFLPQPEEIGCPVGDEYLPMFLSHYGGRLEGGTASIRFDEPYP